MSLLDDKLFDYFSPTLGSGVKFIEDHREEARPPKPYVGYELISNPQVGEKSNGAVDENGIQILYFNKTLTVQLNFYGDNSADDAETFLAKIYDEETLMLGETLNIGLLSTSQSIDTSTKIGKEWERRYSVRVVLSHVVERAQNVGLIETVWIEGEYSGGADVTGNETTLTRIPEDG